MKKYIKLDANETLFVDKELEQIKAKTYDKKYPQLKARSMIPVASDTDPGADSITYFQYDMVGVAAIIESYAKDFPRVDVFKKEFTAKVKSLGDSYGYSIQDIRKARKAGIPLEQRKANAAKLAMMQKEDSIAFLGDSVTGLLGLYNNPNTPEYVLPADGTGASKKFSTKTPDQIIRDVSGFINSVVVLTNEVEFIDTVVLPTEVYTYLNSTPRSSLSDKTILQWLKENFEGVEFMSHYKLAGIGAGATDMMFGYRRDPDVLTLDIPQDFEQFPAQEEGMELVTYCHQRIAGVIMYYPLATVFADDV